MAFNIRHDDAPTAGLVGSVTRASGIGLRSGAMIALLAVCGLASPGARAQDVPVSPAIIAAVSSSERPASDHEVDAARHYAPLLEFWGVRPGMVILDFFAAHGITTEVLARTVGPDGRVYMQNPAWYYERFTRQRVDDRLKGNRLPNVVLIDAPFKDLPLPPHSLDGITINMVFHDLFWMEPQNVPAILNELARVLKPGGFVGIADHAAPDGTGVSLACRGCLHRIEEKSARRMFERAGFVLEAESDLLRNSADDRKSTAFENPRFNGNTDRFVLRFRKL